MMKKVACFKKKRGGNFKKVRMNDKMEKIKQMKI